MSPLPITGMGASSAITNAFALTGKLGLSIDEVVVPTVTVADLSDDVYGAAAIGQAHVTAGGAANMSRCEFSIPQQGSAQGATALITHLIITGNVNGQLIHIGPSVGLPAPTSFGPTNWRDQTHPGLPAVQIAEKNDSPPDGAYRAILSLYVLQFSVIMVPINWLVGENPLTGLQQGVSLQPNALNETMRIGFIWHERVAR